MILGIDPGPTESSVVWLENGKVVRAADEPNEVVAHRVEHGTEIVAIEDFVPYGIRLGHESMATLKWVGIFSWLAGSRAVVIPRPDVKQRMCDCRTAKDADVRDAIIHRYAATAKEAKGTKKQPGPLYGIQGHRWAALAVALVAAEAAEEEK